MFRSESQIQPLRAVLKDESVLALRMSLGRAFQRVGAAAAKALSPQDRRSVLTGCRRLASADLRQRVGVWRWRRSEREGGARLLRAFKVKSRILKSIRYLTGSQWRSWRTGVWSERWVDVSIRAAEF